MNNQLKILLAATVLIIVAVASTMAWRRVGHDAILPGVATTEMEPGGKGQASAEDVSTDRSIGAATQLRRESGAPVAAAILNGSDSSREYGLRREDPSRLIAQKPAVVLRDAVPPTGTSHSQPVPTSPHGAHDCELTDFVRGADTIYELLPEVVITFSRPGGDFLRLQEILAQRVCTDNPVADSARSHELAIHSGGNILWISVGNGRLSTASGSSDLQGTEYVEISEILKNRLLAPGPNLGRQDFDRQFAEELWLQP